MAIRTSSPADPTDDARNAILEHWAQRAGAELRDDKPNGGTWWVLGRYQVWPGEIPMRLLSRALPLEEILDCIDETWRLGTWGPSPRDLASFYARCYERIRMRDDR